MCRRASPTARRWNRCAVLCPIFPVGVCGDGARSGYKYLIEGDIRYDLLLLLLEMVAEVEEKYRQDWQQFAIFGFSGGGHFSHRFTLLHPQRLWAASISAPGSVTLLDPDRDWWVGIRNLPALFGVTFDAAAQVQMVVGAADLETWEITHKEGSRHYTPGVAHDRIKVLDRVKDFLADALSQRRQQQKAARA